MLSDEEHMRLMHRVAIQCPSIGAFALALLLKHSKQNSIPTRHNITHSIFVPFCAFTRLNPIRLVVAAVSRLAVQGMPDESPLHQPNDKLLKKTLSYQQTAAAFLSEYLPQKIATAVDWSPLWLEPGSFGDSQFREHETDLLFSAQLTGSRALVYCLFEHQTREEPASALRLLRYMALIWDEVLLCQVPKPHRRNDLAHHKQRRH